MSVPVRQLRQVGPRPGGSPIVREKCGSGVVITKLFARQSSAGNTPEGRIWASVLGDAWREGCGADRSAARRFFLDGRAQLVADMIGYEGNVLQLFRDHHPLGHLGMLE